MIVENFYQTFTYHSPNEHIQGILQKLKERTLEKEEHCFQIEIKEGILQEQQIIPPSYSTLEYGDHSIDIMLAYTLSLDSKVVQRKNLRTEEINIRT